MTWLQRYYDSKVLSLDGLDFLSQVGHTEGGFPINEQQFQKLAASLVDQLELESSDSLLDLCCGNGIFTAELANKVNSVYAIDFSEAMIAAADSYHSRPNVKYSSADVLEPSSYSEIEQNKTNKVLMHAAIQHFSFNQARVVFTNLADMTCEDSIWLFSFVPMLEQRKSFLESLSVRQRLNIQFRRFIGRDLIKHWWSIRELNELANMVGRRIECTRTIADLQASEYRIDVKLFK